MDISARAFSLAERPQWAIWVTSVRMRREDRPPSRSHPLADLGWKRLIGLRHRILLVAQFLCWDQRPFLRPGPQNVDRAEHGARIKLVGCPHRRSSSARRRVLWPAPPSDASKLVG